jgi:hypothetical protein
MGPLRNAFSLILCQATLILAGCAAANDNSNTTATTAATPPGMQTLVMAPRPAKIFELMKTRGEQEQAQPTIKILSPAQGATINGPSATVRLVLDGDLKGYAPHKDPATGMGNHIHVILDNQPYEAYYELNQPFEMRNLTAGKHTLRVFPSRPWHESYKNAGAFQMVEFTVKDGADATKSTTTRDGQVMASPSPNANSSREGKDFGPSNAGDIDPAKPLLTYSRPKGEYKGDDTSAIMIDFWLLNARLLGDGGQYRVRYSVDSGEPKFLDKWEPIWLSGWINGRHEVNLELVDKDGNPVENGGYNRTKRELTVIR